MGKLYGLKRGVPNKVCYKSVIGVYPKALLVPSLSQFAIILGMDKTPESEEKPVTLPSSRGKQFFYILKENWLTVFYVSLLYFVASFPLIFFVGLSYIHYSASLEGGSSTGEQLFSLILLTIGISLPCFLFLSIGAAGAYGYFGETLQHNDVGFSFFWKSIKKLWLPFLLLYFAEWVFFAFTLFNYGFYLYVDFSAPAKLAFLIISCLLLFLFALAKPYFIIQILFFKTPFISLIRNALLLPFTRLFHSLSTLFASSLFYVLFLFWPMGYLFILVVLYIIFGGAVSLLFSLLFNFSSLEKNLPKEQLGRLYHAGLNDSLEEEESPR